MFRAGVLTISDSSSRGERTDESGPTLSRILRSSGFEVSVEHIVPDDREKIQQTLIAWSEDPSIDFIITTGGTGLSPRDVTPEATKAVLDREIPGIAEILRMESYAITKMAALSRGVAGIRGDTIIINLPGSPKAVTQCMEVLTPILDHAIKKAKGDMTPCHPIQN